MLILLLRLFALFRAVSMRRFNGHLQSMFLEKYEKKIANFSYENLYFCTNLYIRSILHFGMLQQFVFANYD